MNKYLLEVEAIQFTGNNAEEIREKCSKWFGLEKAEDLNIAIESCGNERWFCFSDTSMFYEIAEGSYIVVVPKRGAYGGYVLMIMAEEEFKEYARRFPNE